MPRNLGLQPGREKIWQKGYTIAECADLIGIQPSSHLGLALRGYVPPSEELRRVLPAFLGVPLEELFTPEALAETCRPLPPALRRKSRRVNA